MIVGVLTTCHTQYTWDSSICIFLFIRKTLQVFVTYLTGALYVLLNKKIQGYSKWLSGFWQLVIHNTLEIGVSSSPSSSVICQTKGPKPLSKRFLHTVRSRFSSFNSQYPLLSLRSSSNFLRLLPRLPVTSICPFIFPSVTCFGRQFLRKMWPIQLAFRICIFLFNRTTLQVFVTYLTGALCVLLNKKYRLIRNDCRGFNNLSYTIHSR